MRIIYLFALLFSLVFLSCGYNFKIQKQLPNGIKNIFLEPFKNNTEEVGLGNLFTNKFAKLLASYSFLNTNSNINYNATLKGELLSLYTEDSSYLEKLKNTITEKCLVAEIQVSLNNKSGTQIWHSGKIKGNAIYNFDTENVELTEKNRKKAVDDLTEKLSAIAFQRLTERF